MSNNKEQKLTAHKLMVVFVVLLILIFVATVAGFIYFRSNLEKFADDVSTISGQAESTRSRIQQLQQTESELKKHSEAIDRAASIVSESKSYEYQDQIIRDITNYAGRAGVTITSFNFPSSASTGTTPAPAATPMPAPAAGADSPAPAPSGTSAAAAPKSITVVINLGESVPYASLLNFISMIEHNLTKMQIANVSLTKASDEDSENVSLQSLNLEVYVK